MRINTIVLSLALFVVMVVVASRPAVASPAPDGSITGTVLFSGKAPVNTSWTVSKNRRVCSNAKTLDRIIVDNAGGVANCVIMIKGIRGNPGSLPPPKMEQKGCRFFPHVQAAALGSILTVTNDDDLLHNLHGYFLDEHTTAFNFAQPLENQKNQIKMTKQGMMEIQCDAGHPWMNAFIYVADNPYVAVTEPNGSFSIPNVPPGTYTLQCWHEGWKVLGEKEERPQYAAPTMLEQTVTVGGGSPSQVQFQLSE